MRYLLAFVILVVAAFSGIVALGGDDPQVKAGALPAVQRVGGHDAPAGKMLILAIRVCSTEVPNDQDAKSVTVLSKPQIMSREGQPFSLNVTRRIPVPGSDNNEQFECGLKVNGNIGAAKDGNVPVDLEISYSSVEDGPVKELQVNTESMRAIKSMPLGKTIKLPWGNWGNGARGQRTWVELKIDVATKN